MTSYNQGLWRGPQNTQIPSINHILSFKVAYTALGVGGTTTIALPSTTGLGSAQYTAAQSPTNYAVTASPCLPNNEPQQGLYTYVTSLAIRNLVGGPLTFTGATLNANAVQLIDVTQSNAVVATLAGPAAAATAAPYYVANITQGLVQIAPYDALAVTINASTVVASANTGFVLDVFGYYNQAI
jgi:hypothetical protein